MRKLGDVIVAARRAASLTQEDLSALIGIKQATLSRYENDLREPDSEAIEKIADALSLSPVFLTHEFRLQGAIAADAHMRRQKTTRVSDWKRAEARLNMLRMHSSYLLQKVPMSPQNHVPTFDPDYTSPEDAARLIRAQWRMPIGPVRNVTRWLESAGVIVVEEDLGSRRLDGLSQWASDHPVVIINAGMAPDRKRLTLAHELGHLVLHTQFVDADMEDQANAFAAEFLMPEHLVKSSLRALTLGKLLDLKAEWGVSMAALIERAFRLGRVSASERQNFYRSMSARGWRMKEPGADRVPEESASLAQSIGNSLQAAGLTPSDIAKVAGYKADQHDHWFAPPSRRLRAI